MDSTRIWFWGGKKTKEVTDNLNATDNKCKKHFVKKWGRVGLEEHVH